MNRSHAKQSNSILFLLIAYGFHGTAQAERGDNQDIDLHPRDISKIVNEAMDSQYGEHFDRANQCWNFPFESGNGKRVTYCMAPQAIELVDTSEGKALYFFAANLNNLSSSDRFFYSHTDLGLMGAFKLGLKSNHQWTLLASNKAMEFGSAGSCGCNRARFVKLSHRDDYGWMFKSGGVWQGTTIIDHNIVAAVGSKFLDISLIPNVTESEQHVSYDLEVTESTLAARMVPLSLTKLDEGKRVAEFMVGFDEKRNVYALPVDP